MFRTEIPLTPLPHQLPPSARVLTLGSCFSDAIGARLTEFKVATLVNPFGTVFNPISACKLLRAAAGEDVDWQQHLVEARGRWQSYDLHAEIGADSPVELLQHISQLTREVGVFLATADVVVLTLGSAFAYRLRETGELVSNCHKVGADQFDKELLTADEIIAAVAETHAYLRRTNPKLRFVLTVSPVRHLKDTLVLNSASKAMLRVACHYLSELLPDVTYFPAYELLVDDLRDYRFYATDMLHLSESAENYVWDKFTRTYFDAAFGRFKKEWEGIRQNLGHRPLHPAAPEHRAFLESTLERLRKLGGTADVRMELLHVERELANLPEPKTTAPAPEEVYDDGEERIDIGSFDDQAATSKVQPAAPVVATATEADTKPEAAKKGAAKKEINRAVFAKTRLTSQASLIRPGAGLLVEDAEETEPEETDTTDVTESADSTVSAESAYDHAYSPTITDLTDEAETDEDEADDNEEVNPDETVEEAARRKKRRSRGGAKRTKRKHARLAAEQGNTEGQPEASTVATAPAPLPDAPLPGTPATIAQPDDEEELASEVVYITEAQLRQPRPQPTPPASGPTEPTSTDDTETATPEADEAAPEARRSRNNRRGNKREQAPRYGGRPGRQPLYALDTNGPAPMPADMAPEATATPAEGNTTEPEVSSPVVPASAEASEKPATKQRTPRPKATRQPAAAVATPAEPAPVEATPEVTTPVVAPSVATAAPVAAATPEAAAAKPAARPSRRKPAAQPKAAPEAAAQPAPEPVKTPARKRAAAKPKAPAAPEAAAALEAATVATKSAPPKPAAPAKPVAKPKAPAKAKPKAAAEATTKKPPKAATKPKAAADKAAAVPKATAAKSAPTKAKTAAKPTKKDKPEKPKAQ
ncbi:GSCFA domain-containing protein [Hymenobacter sp. ISL-91]|uniref:GSCFA domain-containing protein n=1 Tax=Hymenobacter sp. ISL-91 TaxID=2819151 RepID=UPI001BE84D05|nr:GSCFA domain-containing protein [Hymenobacter sp. ISL-91]MBT2557341.1 GSCFA domain-containing protein [Hymenobacter sp. ISL-91]